MALIAVPDNRLVTSELHLSKNVTIGVRVLIHLSPFFILSAPVLGSTSVFSNVCLGNLALQFPRLLIQPLRSFFFGFHIFINLFFDFIHGSCHEFTYMHTLQILHYSFLEIRIWVHNLISNFLWR